MKSQLHVWLPTIRSGSGSDVFVSRLSAALTARQIKTTITWFNHATEFMPGVKSLASLPSGVNITHSNSTGAFAFKRKDIPLVVTEHHYVLDPAYRPYKSVAQEIYHTAWQRFHFRRSYSAASAVTAVSQFTADVLRREANVKVDRVIPQWLDYKIFSPGSNMAVDSNKRFQLLFVGNATRRKGADVIYPLARMLGPKFQIMCTGGLRSRNVISTSSNVIPLGRLSESELVNQYRNCDAVLVPSRYEGFGYAALEGMACAKPIVGFRCGAIAEVVDEGKTALLCDVDDIDGLRRHCEFLRMNADVARLMGSAGRIRASTIFSEQFAIDAYIDLYNTLTASC